MKPERLDSLMMLGIHCEWGEKLDLDNVVDRFKARFPKCRISLWIWMSYLWSWIITTLPKILCFFARDTRVWTSCCTNFAYWFVYFIKNILS
jgi:hypothetical protein